MKNILVTGSSGFVGSYFLEKYQKEYTFHTFSFLKDDIKNLHLENIDAIVHLSALVHQMEGADSDAYDRVNVQQTLHLATLAKEAGVGQFIFMSSVKVYGEESEEVYRYDTECKPQDAYGVSKLKAEKGLEKLQSDSFQVSIIRTPIVYGYGVKANIKSLLSLVKSVKILPFKDIQNRRSMVYIGNLAHLIDILIVKKKSGLYLIADDAVVSSSELMKMIAKKLSKKLYLIKVPFFSFVVEKLRPNIYKRLYKSLELDISKTKADLDYHNIYSFEEGIEYMIRGENK